ncbi:aspartate phosphatase, partial [Acinetobacter idrijaensis]
HEKALVHFENTLKIARSLDNDSMVTKALLNVGCCHNDMGQYDKAVYYFDRAVEVGEKIKAKELIQAYYDLALIYLRKGNRETGVSFFEKSLEYVQFFEDALFGRVLNVLKALYIDLGDREHVLYAMNELRNAAGFPYLEELALEAAEFYNRLERLDDSVYFYRQMIDAQKQIRRGDGLYEF